MNLSVTLHLMAGLGAVGLGGGMLLREPARRRNRHFALLCGGLALWNLGLVGLALAPQSARYVWRLIFLFGSCLSAPAGLHFALVLRGDAAATRRRFLAPAYLLAAGLWLSAATPFHGDRRWPFVALLVVGSILAAALGLLGRHASRLQAGPERRAHMLVFWGAVIGVAGGVSDFIPRQDVGVQELGPVAVLLFLLVVCSVIVRYRFLDVDIFLIRVVALLAGATAVGLVYYLVTRRSTSFAVLFATGLIVLAVAGPLGRLILTRARTLLTLADPVAAALLNVSRELPLAGDAVEIWRTIESGRNRLPEDVRLDVYRIRTDNYHLVHRFGDRGTVGSPAPVPRSSALPQLLGEDRLPLTRSFLEQERLEARGRRRETAAGALEQMAGLDLQLAVPLLRGEGLDGWIGAGGGLPGRYLTAEVAAAFLAVGNQAMASLERVEALERAKRKERLATVGELAAGLAHEVRNPVAAIRGASQALGPQATESQTHDMLEVIEEETRRLDRVVGEFLDYARPAPPRRETVDLGRLARRVLKGAELSGRHLESEIVVDHDAPPASGDPDQLHRAFDNLVRNSWEATGDGGRLRIEIHPADGGLVSARFEDNGPGIPVDELPRLFRPFHTTKTGGTGLGLALVHRIVEAHRGELYVEGRPGVGAVFTLVLPAATKERATDG